MEPVMGNSLGIGNGYWLSLLMLCLCSFFSDFFGFCVAFVLLCTVRQFCMAVRLYVSCILYPVSCTVVLWSL
ncbi:hypothetical protein BZA77DRAFT_327115 [Pyronema omphalodes]|nr:hypothetical protein BZA77DRAFT_327115 [Pyronema omphalodes]